MDSGGIRNLHSMAECDLDREVQVTLFEVFCVRERMTRDDRGNKIKRREAVSQRGVD